MLFKLVLMVLCCSIAFARADSYEGYKIYEINAKNDFEKDLLYRLSQNDAYDFLVMPRLMGHPTRVMVPPQEQPSFEMSLSTFAIKFNIINENVGESIAKERIENSLLARSTGRAATFARYMNFAEINAYLDQLVLDYPSRVSVKTIGRSYEGRSLKAITITNGDRRANKKVILLDAGIHAREWIAPAGALYVIQQLVENYSTNAHLLKDYDWVVLPAVNPDGYEYSQTNTRMWRKTRKPVTSLCVGTDGNRNFDFHWGEVGASSISCSGTYKGKTAFSEPETVVLRDLMLSLSGRAKFYLTLHSYGNYLLYPWGYTADLPDTWRDLDEVAQAGAAAIRAATGTKYTVGSSTNVLYAAAGGSDDYAFAKANIPVSITMELPDGGNGFDPAPSLINSLVSETWIGIKAMAEKVIEKY